MGKLEMNMEGLFIAGSETTATLLCGVTYLLLSNPEILKKLAHEVRSGFASEDEITMTSVSKLSYMLACLDEAMRVYPPIPSVLPRIVPKGGTTIVDCFVAENVSVRILHRSSWLTPFG
jgi:cytochrome P450